MRELPLSRLIHENMAIVMTFAFSREPLVKLIEGKFRGEWKYLGKFSLEIPEHNATRASLELAVLLRLLDEDEKITKYLQQGSPYPLGVVHRPDGTTEELHLRETSNKIIHAARLEWDLSNPSDPKLNCHAPPEQEAKFQWKRAEIKIIALAALCGSLMS